MLEDIKEIANLLWKGMDSGQSDDYLVGGVKAAEKSKKETESVLKKITLLLFVICAAAVAIKGFVF